MRTILLAIVAAMAIFLFGFSVNIIFNQRVSNEFADLSLDQGSVITLKLDSSAFEDFAKIPEKYTCDGENTNPPITISGVGQEEQSLVLVMEDFDAGNENFVHWVVANIPAGDTQIASGKTPSGSVQGTSDFGDLAYGGPCPPSGTHRYYFTVYGLSTELDLEAGFTKSDLNREMNGKVVSQAQLVGTYARE